MRIALREMAELPVDGIYSRLYEFHLTELRVDEVENKRQGNKLKVRWRGRGWKGLWTNLKKETTETYSARGGAVG
jgi:hypothetical protein